MAAWRDQTQQLLRVPSLVRDTAAGFKRVRMHDRNCAEPNRRRNPVPPPTFINHVVSPGRRFATATLALSDVKQTSKQLGVTINNLVLAIGRRSTAGLAAALRRTCRRAACCLRTGKPRYIV